ncbi:hypothetical protein [Niallia nealsonii]|uniref:hypothetical protein n=1 Tax=Niallia nealsonii TaxID=115979 RepID=UPI00144767B3|nr:hypothetical protein [Niallia nealsonii]
MDFPKYLKHSTTTYQNMYSEDASIVNFEGGSVKVFLGNIAGLQGPMNSLLYQKFLWQKGQYMFIIFLKYIMFLYMFYLEIWNLEKIKQAFRDFHHGECVARQSNKKSD